MKRVRDIKMGVACGCTGCGALSIYPPPLLDGNTCLKCEGGSLRPLGDAYILEHVTGVEVKVTVDTADLDKANAKAGRLADTLQQCREIGRSLAREGFTPEDGT